MRARPHGSFGKGWSSPPVNIVAAHCYGLPKAPKQAFQALGRLPSHKPKELRNSQFRAFSTISDNEDFYRFTRARFVQNEASEMASRQVRFNVTELANTAARCIGAGSCTRVEKLPDGMHNRALLLTMDTGEQLVAKIPNPNAGAPHFTTASEVATMDFMRTQLKTPVPRVYAWCSHAGETPVEAEYIIMEKAKGVPLKSVWNKMELRDQAALVKAITRLQAVWSSAAYGGYGSIYYASDLTDHTHMPIPGLQAHEDFALGPITGRDWNDDGRRNVSFDRGPWKTLEEYLEAVGRREMRCVKELPRLPPPQVTLCGPGLYESTREKKLQALNYYLQIFRHLVPQPDDSPIRRPSAWHGDLHVENIFVDPTDPTTISSIIDWQSTEVAPLFVQARQPYILDFEGPQLPELSTEPPRLPDNFAELSSEWQAATHSIRLKQSLCVAYRRWTRGLAPEVWMAFEFQATPASELLQLARCLLVDGEGLYIARVVEHLRSPRSILQNSGLSLPEAVMAEAEADGEKAVLGIQWMTKIRETIGDDLFPERGCVRTEHYAAAKSALRQCKEQVVEEFAKIPGDRQAWDEAWPFDD